ncbi:hypothetical protein J2S19_003959 [Metabacillus malikii]|uniref:Uncharacterized protein n=1 Tax=Metabacillus malikii TaxID=1504265 RepID=A0ABT9ZK42_9BACI|nr:hypothetical protein [Metabacillus malikii]
MFSSRIVMANGKPIIQLPITSLPVTNNHL